MSSRGVDLRRVEERKLETNQCFATDEDSAGGWRQGGEGAARTGAEIVPRHKESELREAKIPWRGRRWVAGAVLGQLWRHPATRRGQKALDTLSHGQPGAEGGPLYNQQANNTKFGRELMGGGLRGREEDNGGRRPHNASVIMSRGGHDLPWQPAWSPLCRLGPAPSVLVRTLPKETVPGLHHSHEQLLAVAETQSCPWRRANETFSDGIRTKRRLLGPRILRLVASSGSLLFARKAPSLSLCPC